jgi:H+/gluconate symporter-like permease
MILLCHNPGQAGKGFSAYGVLRLKNLAPGGNSMGLKAWALMCASTFAVIIVGAIVGNLLESSGTLSEDAVRYKGQNMVQFAFFILFLLLCFTIIPFAIKLFIFLQIKIGHGEFFMIRWLQAHEQKVIYALWGLLFIGSCFAVPSAIKDGLFK